MILSWYFGVVSFGVSILRILCCFSYLFDILLFLWIVSLLLSYCFFLVKYFDKYWGFLEFLILYLLFGKFNVMIGFFLEFLKMRCWCFEVFLRFLFEVLGFLSVFCRRWELGCFSGLIFFYSFCFLLSVFFIVKLF